MEWEAEEKWKTKTKEVEQRETQSKGGMNSPCSLVCLMVQIFGSLENLSLTLILRRDSLVQPLVSLSLSGSPTFPKRT